MLLTMINTYKKENFVEFLLTQKLEIQKSILSHPKHLSFVISLPKVSLNLKIKLYKFMKSVYKE